METGYKFCILLVWVSFKVKYVTTQVCQTGTSEMGWPGTGDANSVGNAIDGFGAGTGYLIPLTTYTADCCGYVTQIETRHDNLGTTTAQVWRPTSGTSYTLVGKIDITGNNKFTTNVPAASQVKVQVGDVVGWYSASANLVRYKRNTGLNGNLYKPSTATAVGVTVNWGAASIENDVTYAMKFYLSASSAPTFTNLPTTKSVLNSAAVSTSVHNVSVTDADVSDVATLIITRTDTNAFFSFDSATNQVSIGSVLVGAIGNHQLVFEVSDSCVTATSTLTIAVSNAPPTFHNLDNSTSLSENTQTATLLYTLSVTDATDVVSCSLLTASVPFTVRQISGSTTYGIYCNCNPGFNYATRNSYPLSIQCTDGYDAVTGTFTVYLIRNSAPNITNLPNHVTLSTASTTGSVVYTVSSTDAENDQLYYNMMCTPASCPFTILNSGVIQVTQNLRSLTTVGYDVNVWVFDGRTLVGPKTLTVDITGCPTNYTPTPGDSNSCIHFVTSPPTSFADAKAACASEGAHLLKLSTVSFPFIRQHLIRNSDMCQYWVGAEEGEVDGDWKDPNNNLIPPLLEYFRDLFSLDGIPSECGVVKMTLEFFVSGAPCAETKCFICEKNI